MVRGWWIGVLVGCADPNTTAVMEGGLSWAPCSLYGDDGGRSAQCAMASLPRTSGEGETIDVFVQRVITRDATRQLWIVGGAAGEASAGAAAVLDRLADVVVDTDLYLMESRGTGRSTRLGCPVQEADGSLGGSVVMQREIDGCIAAATEAWGEDLAGFSTVDMARDLGDLVASLRGDHEVFVLGIDHGGRIAMTLASADPAVADGVILDAPDLDPDLDHADRDFDDVGDLLLQRCSTDPICRDALGPHASAQAAAILDRMAAGHCRAASTPDALRLAAGALIADPDLAGLAPAAFARADRCGPDDVVALQYLVDGVGSPEVGPPDSAVLAIHLQLTEAWSPLPPKVEVFEAELDTLRVTEARAATLRPLVDRWPVAADGVPTLPELQIPLRILHGSLDPRVPIWHVEGWMQGYTGAAQHLVRFPDAGHGVLRSDRTGACAARLVADFVEAPGAIPEASCVDDLPPLSFDGSPTVGRWVFGAADPYGSGCGGSRAGAGVVGLGLAWGIRRRRRLIAR